MIKKTTLILIIAGLITATPLFGLSLTFAPAGGVDWTLGDRIDEGGLGYHAGGSIELEVWKGFDYGLRYFYSTTPAVVPNQFNTDTTLSSYNVEFVRHVFQLTNSWSPGWRWVDPYVRGSLGLYPWQELSADTLLQAIIIDSQTKDTTYNELKATSFGVSVGTGVRIWPTQWLGLRVGVDYDLIFSEDRDKFGVDDANDNLLRVGGEVVFRVPLK